MSRLGILNSGSLLGGELKQMLERRRELWRELELLELEAEDYATVSEVAGEAVIVKAADEETLARLDLLFVCPAAEGESAGPLPGLEAAGTVIFLDPAAAPPGAEQIVAGINLERARPGGALVSPHPGVIALAHLLRPLAGLGLEQAVAWLVEPASSAGQAGVDELLDQTRKVLAFDTAVAGGVFGRRLAHNLYPAGAAAALADGAARVLGGELELSVELVRAGVFHSLTASVWARCAPETSVERVRDALAAHPHLRLDDSSQPPGPVEAAGAERLLLAAVRADRRRPGAFWLWGALDNLTLGGAANAVAIAELILEPG